MSKIGNVTLSGKNATTVNETTKLLEAFSGKCTKIKSLLETVPSVTVELGATTASGAVTVYRASKIKVSDLPGGVQEIAESVLFELLNWQKGDFVGAAHKAVKEGKSAPREAGVSIAKTEATVAYEHASLMDELKRAGVTLSKFGTRNRDAKGDKDLGEFIRLFLICPHDSKAQGTAQSLPSGQMYTRELIENNDPTEMLAPAVLRGIAQDTPPWLTELVTGAASQITDDVPYCTVYVKLLELVAKYKFAMKPGYEFTPAMKQILYQPVVSGGYQTNLRDRVLKGLPKPPADLEKQLKEVGLLS